MTGAFYCMQCPSCGVWQSCDVRGRIQDYVFNCRRDQCEKSRKAHHTGRLGLQIKMEGPFDARQAAKMTAVNNCLNAPMVTL